jgi:carbon monoxide dehydrogenase subunit G
MATRPFSINLIQRISLLSGRKLSMIRFEGDRQLPLAPADAWLKLRDARFLIQCVQGGTITGAEPTQDQAQCKVRPNLPFVQGIMEVTLRVVEAQEPKVVRVMVSGQGGNATCEVETRLELAEKQAATHVHWSADVRKLGGMLQAAPATQVQAAAQKVVDETWKLLSLRIGK